MFLPLSFFLALSCFYIYILLLTFVFLADEIGPKSAMVESKHRMLKRPHEESRSNSPRSVSFEDLKFFPAMRSSIPEVQPQKKQQGKMVTAKEKDVMEVNVDVSSTSVEKFELNVLAKNFPY